MILSHATRATPLGGNYIGAPYSITVEDDSELTLRRTERTYGLPAADVVIDPMTPSSERTFRVADGQRDEICGF